MVGSSGHGAEYPNVAAPGLANQSAHLPRLATQLHPERTPSMEPQQAGHLGLAPADQQRDLCLREALRRGLANSKNQLSPGICHSRVAATSHLRQIDTHTQNIAYAI